MTAFALRSKLAAMNVVDVVTAHATRREGDAFLKWFTMARLARDTRVGAVETERRPRVVVELPCAPSARVVAIAAACSQPAPVRVDLGVTREAVAARVLEELGCVAALAGHCGVLTEEREAGEIVVEEDLARPTARVMARFAACPLLPMVGIVVAVAAVTGDVEMLGVEHPSVADGACHTRVASL